MKPNKFNGFTLIELMVTITMIAIVLIMGVPSFRDTIMSNMLTAEINEFVAVLNYARSEAVVRSRVVTVRQNFTKLADSGKWENGWIVFIDENQNGFQDGTDAILRVHEALRTNHMLRSNGINFYISYMPDGFRRDNDTSYMIFVLCDNSDDSGIPRKRASRVFMLTLLGHITMGKDSDGNGIPEMITETGPVNISSCTKPFS